MLTQAAAQLQEILTIVKGIRGEFDEFNSRPGQLQLFSPVWTEMLF